MEQINEALEEFSFQDNLEIYEKEYKKVKNKLSKKYRGEELDYQIKMKLFQKGFKN